MREADAQHGTESGLDGARRGHGRERARSGGELDLGWRVRCGRSWTEIDRVCTTGLESATSKAGFTFSKYARKMLEGKSGANSATLGPECTQARRDNAWAELESDRSI